MQVTRLLYVAFALLPVVVAAQSVSTQPARQRDGGNVDTRDAKPRAGTMDTRETKNGGSRDGTRENAQRPGSVDTRDVKQSGSRDGSRAEGARQYSDAQSPGKSENSQGKKGAPPGQDKKSKNKK